MKKFKRILAIAMVVMMGVVFTPMMPGVKGVAEATESAEFYAVFNTAVEGTKLANTLSFYYDANKPETGGTKTVYSGNELPTNAQQGSDWGYDDNRSSISNVVIDASVADYHGLKSTVCMFASMNEVSNINGCEYLDVRNVTDMGSMFASCGALETLDVSEFDTGKVESMESMFADTALTELDLSNFNTSKVENMESMFAGCGGLTTLDISGFDTSNVETMNYMFYGCSNLITIKASNGFVTSNVSSGDDSGMFSDCIKLVGGNGTTYSSDHVNKEYARIDEAGTPGYFTGVQHSIQYKNADGKTKVCKEYTEVTASTAPVTWNEGWYVVNSDVNISDRITCNGEVHLILVDDKELTASKGITCTGGGNSFTVYGQSEGTGLLNATGQDSGAGIGGGMDQNGSGITINGGTVTATGGANAAGIGGGNEGIGSNITINGGNVTANGGSIDVAGIGNGDDAEQDASDIKISTGLTVKADGNNPPKATITNTGEDLASKLAGKRYVTAMEIEPVAQIVGGKTYSTVQKAVGEATKGQTVKMLSDSTENIEVNNTKEFTLDLNDHVLSGKGDDRVIDNCGKLTITDSADSDLTTRYFTDSKCEHGVAIGGSCLVLGSECAANDEKAVADRCYETYTTQKPGDMTGVLTVTGGCITGGNVSGNGGAILNRNDAKLTIDGGNIVGNRASYEGGAVHNEGTLKINDGTIGGCSAGVRGGAICTYGNAEMADGMITTSSAGYLGGAVIAFNGTFTMTGGTVTDCMANEGGGVCTYYNGTFNMKAAQGDGDTIIENCQAAFGGAVNCSAGSFHMYGGTIKDNAAVPVAEEEHYRIGVGGGVYNGESASSFHMHGGIIENNSATDYAGGVSNCETPFGGNGCSFDGKCIVKDNYSYEGKEVKDENKVTSNLYITYAPYEPYPICPVIIGDGGSTESYTGKGSLLNGSEIGVMLYGGTGQFTTNGTKDDVQYFFSDNEEYSVEFVKGNDELEEDDLLYNDHLELVEQSGKTVDPSAPANANYTVTFDVQGHGTAPVSQTVAKGDKVKKPADPTASGYVFEGWFKEAACTNAWDFDKDTATADTKLYAKWKEEEPQPVVVKDGFMATGNVKKATNTIKWNAVEDADGYDVYYAKCGKTLKKIKSTTALKYTKKGLKTKNIYKYQVRAYEKVAGEKEYIATTPVIHVAGAKAKFSNATRVTANPDGIHMEAGETDVIRAKIVKKSSKKTVLWKNHVSAKISYISTDKSVVTVDGSGNIEAIDAGTAYVYAYAASGAFAKVQIIVE